jgi:hypothetical protein
MDTAPRHMRLKPASKPGRDLFWPALLVVVAVAALALWKAGELVAG